MFEWCSRVSINSLIAQEGHSNTIDSNVTKKQVRASNENADSLVNLLQSRSDVVKRVYHPSTEATELYDEYRNEGGGYGALLSIQFCNDMQARRFYDSLDAAKGPGFGSNFTLVCPYTMIAHFNELDWCRSFGIDPNLVRVWVGLEER